MKNVNFRDIIDNTFLPLMGKKCVMLNLPYYPNPGDCMIWMGMEQFMNRHGIECVYRASAETFVYRPLPCDVVICFVGGGNFGDLWNEEEQLVCGVSKLYPHNRIIVFPQSVHYCDEKRLLSESNTLSQHSDLHICARDEKSYQLLKSYFSQNNILLAPDMALYLEFPFKELIEDKGKLLFLKREDKEAINYGRWNITNADIMDWPMMDLKNIDIINDTFINKMRHRLLRQLVKFVGTKNVVFMYSLCSVRFLKSIDNNSYSINDRCMSVLAEIGYLKYLAKNKSATSLILVDWFAKNYFLPIQITCALDFINQYNHIITTRLHAGIMAILLDKEVEFIDNSYGKISATYQSWLADLPNVKLYK